MKEIPVGIDDFKVVRENDYFYIDKTPFIEKIAKGVGKTFLFTRPRRFGKSLNMSMLGAFFEIMDAEQNKKYFQDLQIGNSGFFSEQGKYPVIYISLKDVKQRDWLGCLAKMKQKVREVFKNKSYIEKTLSEFDREDFFGILKKEDDCVFEEALKFLCGLLYKHHRKKVVVLFDEYDTPIIEAYHRKYYDEAVSFFRNLYGALFKGNEYLHIGVLTGITRIAKEGIFSGLSNLVSDTVLDTGFEECFGLTEKEVCFALEAYELGQTLPAVREWYNGYRFGNADVYNPWSIVNYLQKRETGAHWVNTSSNELIYEVLKISEQSIFSDLTALFSESATTEYINKDMTFDNLTAQESLWTLLLASGYLTVDAKLENDLYRLRIPNKEVRSFFKDMFIGNFGATKTKTFYKVLSFLKQGKITGDNSFESNLQALFLARTSYFDLNEKENFYHVFMLGLLSGLEDEYIGRSNMESGHGRADLLLEPKDRRLPGFIFEFKVAASEKDLNKQLDMALRQIVEKKYAVPLREIGIKDVTGIAIAFHGKTLKVKYQAL
ncbi:MAG: ATP-binding protein [Fusobacteriaceae bacterium]|jgi:hypothetical protein|nr:ATP-binding protein [Fusobacteriaceae bacterium]